MKTTIKTDSAPVPIGPYSQAVMVGETLYISGQIALDPETGKLTNTDVKEETAQVLKNISAIIQEAGMTMSDIVKCTVFVTNMKHFPSINEVYGGYFKENPPARETVEVSGLPMDVRVEISAVAVKG